jgi:hypothetical protein
LFLVFFPVLSLAGVVAQVSGSAVVASLGGEIHPQRKQKEMKLKEITLKQ